MNYQVWECKIVVSDEAELQNGADYPPRMAAITAVERMGITVLGCFSGWGGTLTDTQKIVLEEVKDGE